jgi:TonB family protein
VKLASIETPAKIEKEKPKPKPKSEDKPVEKPPEPKKDLAGSDAKTEVGDGEVKTTIGSGGVEGGLSDVDFPYDIWRVTQIIDRNWENPVLTQKTLACVIYFQIDRTGRIRGAAIEKGSGNDQFDSHALRAVERTKNLPPLPLTYKYDVLGFHLEFEYTP